MKGQQIQAADCILLLTSGLTCADSAQGCFKADLAVEEVVTGQEFERRSKNLPAMWLVEKVLIRVRSFSPAHKNLVVAPFSKSRHLHILRCMFNWMREHIWHCTGDPPAFPLLC